MNPENWRKISDALDKLMELPDDERADYLMWLHQHDEQLGNEVESLYQEQLPKAPLESPPIHLVQDRSHVAEEPTETPNWLPDQAKQSVTVDQAPKTVGHGILPNAAEKTLRDKNRAEFPEQAGRYLIQSEIARGGMGAVFRALDPDIERPLAVKILLQKAREIPGAASRFLKEAQITGQLQHPGVPPIHELGRLEDGRPFFAMKLIDGQTLSELLKDLKSASGVASAPRESRLFRESNSPGAAKLGALTRPRSPDDLTRFINIFEHICQTLAFAHSRSIIHRDLKPQNIMVGAFGEVQVMDWGLAKKIGNREWGVGSREAELESVTENGSGFEKERSTQHGSPDSPLPTPYSLSPAPDSQTATGDVMGTPAFMAPEQARGEIDELDERTDVFGLGGILCAILTGKPPFRGENARVVLDKAKKGEHSETNRQLDLCRAELELIHLAKKCLAPVKAERFQHAGEVADAVARYRQGVQDRLKQAELAREKSQLQAAEERRRKKLWVALAGAVLTIVLLAGGGAFWLQQQNAQHLIEQARRETELRRSTQGALDEFDRLQLQSRWEEAETVLSTARKHLDKNSFEDLHQRLDQADKNLHLAKVLDVISLQKVRFAGSKIDSTDRSRTREKATKIYIDIDTALRAYEKAFRRANLARLGDRPEQVTDRIKKSPIRKHLIKALTDWAFCARQADLRTWCLRIANDADNDARLMEFRDPAAWTNRESMQKLAEKVKPNKLPPFLLMILGEKMHATGGNSVNFFRKCQRSHPDSFWINFALAKILASQGTGVEYARAAMASRPKIANVHFCLGLNLIYRYIKRGRKADLNDSVEAYLNTTRLDPKHTHAYNNLGNAQLLYVKNVPAAIDAYRKALEIDPKYADAHYHLGQACESADQWDDAIAAYRSAIKYGRRTHDIYDRLGYALLRRCREGKQQTGDLEQAVDVLQKATLLKPQDGRYHGLLAEAFARQKNYGRAYLSLQRSITLTPKSHPDAANLVDLMKTYIFRVDNELRAIGKTGSSRKNTEELLALARIAYNEKKLYATAAALHAQALDKIPKRSDDELTRLRQSAARSALLAVCGKGEDAKGLDEKRKHKLRVQALNWLNANFRHWNSRLEQDMLNAPVVSNALNSWQNDLALSRFRQSVPEALPAQEQTEWNKLWSDVSRISIKARDSYSETVWKRELTAKTKERAQMVKLLAGKTYELLLRSRKFDTVLRLERANGTPIAENDDIRLAYPRDLNSRIVYSPNRDDVFRIIAASYKSRGRGAYSLTLREFAIRKK